MTLTGNYKEHKECVIAKMEKRCMVLAAEDSISRGELRELAVTSGIVSIFRATAGVVPWTGAELDDISKLWIWAFKQAWKYPKSMDKSAIILDKADSSCACPSGWALGSLDGGHPASPGPLHLPTWRYLHLGKLSIFLKFWETFPNFGIRA
jgi:hypothetical protein